MQWLPAWTDWHAISTDGRSLVADGPLDEDGFTQCAPDGVTRSWALARRLPGRGVTRWSVRIERCTSGRIAIGVADAAGVCGWGFEPRSGALVRYTRDAAGAVDLLHPSKPPAECPDGVPLRLMASNLRGTAESSVVELAVDADAGSVSFTVDERGVGRQRPPTHVAHPRTHVLRGFPAGVRLRPWAMLFLHVGDEVTLFGGVEEGEDECDGGF